MKPIRIITCAVLFLFLFPFYAAAGEITGQQLARQVFDRDRGMDATSSAQMVLVNKTGKKRIRHFYSRRITEEGLERQIIKFTAPADIKGTGFLTIEKPGWETEQFLYLPALRRTRRIVTSQKSHRFVNSDFTYEDMERHPVDNYTYKLTGSANLGSQDCHILESRPKPGVESQYSLIVSYIVKQSFVPVAVEYFNKKGTHFKTYKVLKLERIKGIWTEIIVSMEDKIKPHTSYLKIEKQEYNTGINKADISRKKLETL